MKKKKKKTQEKINSEIRGLLFLCGSLVLFISLYTTSAGVLGAFIKKLLTGILGRGAIIAPVFIMLYSFNIFTSFKYMSKYKFIALFITGFVANMILHLSFYNDISHGYVYYIKYSIGYGNRNLGGGAFSAMIDYFFIKLLGIPGSWIVLSTLLVTNVVTIFNISLKKTSMMILNKLKNIFNYIIRGIINFIYVEEKKDVIINTPSEQSPTKDEVNKSLEEIISKSVDLSDVKIVSEEKKIAENNKTTQKTGTKNYMRPPYDLLRPGDDHNLKENKQEIKNNIKILEDTLKSFGIDARVVQVSCGPTITRYELQPSPGVKVSRIINLVDDISLSLATSGVRLEVPIPGKSAIGIEVPNKKIRPVFLREVLESPEFINSKSDLSIALGKDISGANIISDLSKMPHLLIAGATGSGKSVCINTLITSLLYKSDPENVRLLLIDPKVVELSVYNGISHLIAPVVTNPKKAAGALNWAVQEMIRRYNLFAEKGVRDINRYNEIEQNKLPKIVIIIDELSDLMMASPAEVEDAICRLAQMARAAGMHLVIATQRPSVDVITGVIKANIPSRIAFAVSSQVDSRTILDMAGAEKLLGKGDMLFYPAGEIKPLRVQGCFISEKEVESIVDWLKTRSTPEYYDNLIERIEEPSKDNKDNDADELLPQAINIVLEAKQASTSLLQRKLKIGYARAARLMDQMEERGIVSKSEGNKPRQVLLTKDQLNL
ncbi:DNA translocase FtsK [Caldanaerobius fijiensis DSM 17918]|uniref:DNA translocase FtsK n=1 Tax=Caldanaerobius fijiensis DSM 17918 TaxID=1121256 RepID=A0A1M4YB13_9THEO|nr:DNA translocase FtsK [Caldanaerobius fijiensis]SHF02964.1 DNA translocase FtsK [Caldanaerobius fijiensis DSM 17918]